MNNYDTVDGITSIVKDLDGLHQLDSIRYEAGYKRKERLHTFIINKKWVTDSCGNMGRITNPQDLNILKDNVVDVESIPRFINFRYSWRSDFREPTGTSKCPVCEKGWTLDNATDSYFHETKEASTWYHVACWRVHQMKRELDFFIDLFAKAGFKYFPMAPIQNEYAPDEMWCAPWFKVHTEVGVIKIGWRKRVVHIDWSDTDRDCLHLFPDTSNTVTEHYVHAYTEAEMVKFLTRLRENIPKLPPSL